MNVTFGTLDFVRRFLELTIGEFVTVALGPCEHDLHRVEMTPTGTEVDETLGTVFLLGVAHVDDETHTTMRLSYNDIYSIELL